MDKEACSDCFQNFGIKSLAKKYGKEWEGVCNSCGSSNGKLLHNTSLLDLMYEFFCEGTRRPPFLIEQVRLNTIGGDCSFDTQTEADLRLLTKFCKVKPFFYGPRQIFLGMTYTYQKLYPINAWKAGISIDEAAESIGKYCQIPTINNRNIYRIQLNTDDSLDPGRYDAPPPRLAQSNRYNLDGESAFYGSFNIETCIHETKVTLEDNPILATFEPLKPLRVLDLTTYKKPEISDDFDSDGWLIDYLSFTKDQKFTNLCVSLMKYAERLGLDGISYWSYYRKGTRKRHKNIVMHGRPLERGLLKLTSLNYIRIDDIKYSFSFGPLLPVATASL